MLVRVVARSRADDQFVENKDGPNGFDDPSRLVRCGIEPALKRFNTAVFPPEPLVVVLAVVSIPETPGRKGLVDGVGLDVLDMKD
jgi:hypothetical protein